MSGATASSGVAPGATTSSCIVGADVVTGVVAVEASSGIDGEMDSGIAGEFSIASCLHTPSNG